MMDKHITKAIELAAAAARVVLDSPLAARLDDWDKRKLENHVVEGESESTTFSVDFKGEDGTSVCLTFDGCGYPSLTNNEDGSVWASWSAKTRISWSSVSMTIDEPKEFDTLKVRIALYAAVVELAEKIGFSEHFVCIRTAEEEAQRKANIEAETKARETMRKIRSAAEFVRKAMRVGSTRDIPAELLEGVGRSHDYALTFKDYGGKDTRVYNLHVRCSGVGILRRTA
jgi:hypothetical protein